MKVIFSHGKESGPWGTKIKRLAKIARKHTCEVDSLDYRAYQNPDDRVYQLLNYLNDEKEEFILVGSSMGGYVSLVVSEKVMSKGLFLLAPALFLGGYQKQDYRIKCADIEIIHGWQDEVIPYQNSVKFAKNVDCSLHLISGDHRLNCSLEIVENLFEQFLLRILHD